MLEQGPVERTILEQCLRQNLPIPDKIKNAPELRHGLELFLLAYFELSSNRQLGFGEGPIPWFAIHLYCEFYGIYGDQREDLQYHLTQLDHTFLTWKAKQTKNETKSHGHRGSKKLR